MHTCNAFTPQSEFPFISALDIKHHKLEEGHKDIEIQTLKFDRNKKIETLWNNFFIHKHFCKDFFYITLIILFFIYHFQLKE